MFSRSAAASIAFAAPVITAAALAWAAAGAAPAVGVAPGAGEPWPYLPNQDIEAPAFKAAHPTWDGRGVVVAILDTGVDAFAPGLTQTSTSQTKLLDVRDFSTEGDWKVAEAERDTTAPAGELVFKHPDGLRLTGAAALAVPPAPGDGPAGRVYIGYVAESRFKNSRGARDLNDDGDTQDSFGFLVWQAERAAVEAKLGVGKGYEQLGALGETARRGVARDRESARVWLVAVDTDGNGSLAGESVLRDYRVDHDTFRFTNPSAPKARTMMAWAVNVIAKEDRLGQPQPPRVEFHFDDGAHGSHCAGIATGFGVGGQAGMDGVAPGAWLLSLKIGDNTLEGGASRTESMKQAFDYAWDFSKKFDLPVVISMSYGISAVEEGQDAYGKYLDEQMAKRPGLVYCTSAGNEGPGLSTIGLPATSPSVIASGAYLSPATAASLYNARLTRPTLFAFSSRGAETAKPDVVAPGSALSTVPGWVEGTGRMNGTSMANPTTAGASACLLSAAKQEGLKVHWGMIKRALIIGARPVAGLELLDQGGGLVNLPGAWETLRRLAASKSARQVLNWRVETACPFQDDGKAPAAYWRTDGGAPLAPRTVTFTVRPVFHPDLTPDEKNTFFRSFTFRSEADWLRPVTGKAYVRGGNAMTVDVQYDGARLAKPGLYTARIVASLDGGDLSGAPAQEFTLWNTVVVPDPVGAAQGYTRTWEGKGLAPSCVQRHFVAVPAGASALRVRLEVSDRIGARKGARVLTEIFDPDGMTRGPFAGYAGVEGTPVRDVTILPPELKPGIWEIDCVSAIAAMDPGDYRLTASFDGYACGPDTLRALARPAAGSPAVVDLAVTRAFPGVLRGRGEAAIDGYRRARNVTVTDADTWTLPFKLDRVTPEAEFTLTMDKKTANLFTDCAVNIVDASGKRIVSGGIVGREARISWRLPEGTDSAEGTLEVVGGFALERDETKWGFDLEERYLLASPTAGAVTLNDEADLSLYSGVPAKLAVTFTEPWPAAPEGLQPFGAVRLLDHNLADKAPGDRADRLVLEVPIRLK